MASLAAASRLSARLTVRAVRRKAPSRGLKTSAARCVASNFTMPAMSPTMQEGNITSWKVKEGDAFSAGDLLLEIETDKAQMDVEAQDDGILMKITQPDGSKSVKIGTRIAVIAEPGDDISALELPEEDTSASQSQPSGSKSSSEAPTQEQAKTEPPPPSKEPLQEPKKESSPAQEAAAHAQKYPLYPSVGALLHTHGISDSEAGQIRATGPNGRLLKGDVLAYLGSIDKSYPKQQAKRLEALSHLDLSNIKKAAPPAKKAQQPSPTPLEVAVEPPTEIAVPVSLAEVYKVQARIQTSLGLTLPLSTFIARASEIANENLPRAKGAAPSADELFDAVLGIDTAKKTSRGHYVPQITSLAPAPIPVYGPMAPKKGEDIIDVLTGLGPKKVLGPMIPRPAADVASDAAKHVFSVSVNKGEERRARIYLERVRSVLEAEPGRCVL